MNGQCSRELEDGQTSRQTQVSGEDFLGTQGVASSHLVWSACRCGTLIPLTYPNHSVHAFQKMEALTPPQSGSSSHHSCWLQTSSLTVRVRVMRCWEIFRKAAAEG